LPIRDAHSLQHARTGEKEPEARLVRDSVRDDRTGQQPPERHRVSLARSRDRERLADESASNGVAFVPGGSRDDRFLRLVQRRDDVLAAPVSVAVRAVSDLVRFSGRPAGRSRRSRLLVRQGVRLRLLRGSGQPCESRLGPKGEPVLTSKNPAPKMDSSVSNSEAPPSYRIRAFSEETAWPTFD